MKGHVAFVRYTFRGRTNYMYNDALYSESQGQEKSQCERGVNKKDPLTCHSKFDSKNAGSSEREVEIPVFTWVAGAAAGFVAAHSSLNHQLFSLWTRGPAHIDPDSAAVWRSLEWRLG